MTANQLIKTLELYSDKEYCSFDVPMNPDHIVSWRGSYSEPAIVVTDDRHASLSASEWIALLKAIDGKEVTGWKGGEFILSGDSDLWLVSCESQSGHTGISHVTCVDDFEVIIHTCYQKY